MKWILTAVAGVALAGSACVSKPAVQSQGIALGSLKSQVSSLSQKLSNLNFKVSILESKPYGSAVLDPSEKGYSRVDTDQGSFLLAVRTVSPYLDGYRVVLDVGNLQDATYDGITLDSKWGKPWKFGGRVSYTDWYKRLNEKKFVLTNTLLPGTWNRVPIVLSPAKADQLGYLEVSMKTSEVSLLGR